MIYSIGETLIDIFEKEQQEFLGGTSANFCAAIAKFGGQTSIITKLGKDGASRIINELSSFGVDTSRILIDQEHPTGRVIISSVDGNSLCEQRRFCADCYITEQEIDTESFSSDDVLHFCSFALIECPTKYATQKAIAAISSKGGKVAFDINLRLRQWNGKDECLAAIESVLKKTHYLKASAEELETLYENQTIDKKIDYLFDFSQSLSIVILTNGEHGSALYTRNGDVFYSAYDAKVVDSTGAGDCLFASAILLLSRLSEKATAFTKNNLQEILDFSTAAASLQSERLGAIDSIPSIEEIKKLLAQNNCSD